MGRYQRPPYFPFYPADFASDGKVEIMTLEEIGAYILLLCKAWQETPPCTVPNDDEILSAWARISPVNWLQLKSKVMAPWRLGTDNRYTQPRLFQEFQAFSVRARAARTKGKRGAKARWDRDLDARGIASSGNLPMPKHGFPSPSPSPSPITPLPPKGGIPPEKTADGNSEATEIFGALDRTTDTGDPHGPDLSPPEQAARAVRLGISGDTIERTEADPLEQAMARFKGSAANIGGTMRRKCCEAANEYGEDRVIAALNWAADHGQPYGDALSMARRKSWNAADVAAGGNGKATGKVQAAKGKYDHLG